MLAEKGRQRADSRPFPTPDSEAKPMSEEHTEELYELRVTPKSPATELPATGEPKGVDGSREQSGSKAAPGNGAPDKARDSGANKVSKIKAGMRDRLPALDDDAEVGVQKEHIVTRDGEADLRFTGVLLASAAPGSAPKGRWQEYRVYQTTGGKHVFSKVTRNVLEGEEDTHQAEVFDPSPSSVPSQLLRSAREIARSRPMTWMDAATAFFGYDPLAKGLYRKLSVSFEETIS
jgi:hypothetical protein